jgi:hypothetical protein
LIVGGILISYTFVFLSKFTTFFLVDTLIN